MGVHLNNLRRRLASWLWTPFPSSEWQASLRWNLTDAVYTATHAAQVPRETDVQRRVSEALASREQRPGGLCIAFAHTAPGYQPARASAAVPATPVSLDWLNSTPHERALLFGDVVNAPPEDEDDEREDDGNAPTILTKRAKKRQVWRTAISQLLPARETESE